MSQRRVQYPYPLSINVLGPWLFKQRRHTSASSSPCHSVSLLHSNRRRTWAWFISFMAPSIRRTICRTPAPELARGALQSSPRSSTTAPNVAARDSACTMRQQTASRRQCRQRSHDPLLPVSKACTVRKVRQVLTLSVEAVVATVSSPSLSPNKLQVLHCIP